MGMRVRGRVEVQVRVKMTFGFYWKMLAGSPELKLIILAVWWCFLIETVEKGMSMKLLKKKKLAQESTAA
jgi:hypothetical protein